MIEPSFYVRALVRGWWIVVAAALVAAGGAWLASSWETPVYKASATLVTAPSSTIEDTGDLLDAVEVLERRTVVATLARVATTRETRRRAADRMGVEPDSIRYYWIGSTVLPSTNIVRIDVIGPEPERTARVADAVAAATRRDARGLYKIFTLRHLDEAEVPRDPERPNPGRSALIGAALGLFFGVLAACVVEAVRSR